MSNLITTKFIDHVAVIRFTRPEIRNPLSMNVIDELEAVIAEIIVARKVIFTGSDGVFASGADLREIGRLSAEEAPEFARRGQALMEQIAAIRVPTVAAIDGPCFGGALDLALACKERKSTADSTFCHPGTGLGIITGWGGTQRMPRLIGETKALEMFLTAQPVSAAEAKRIGLIDQVEADPLLAALSS